MATILSWDQIVGRASRSELNKADDVLNVAAQWARAESIMDDARRVVLTRNETAYPVELTLALAAHQQAGYVLDRIHRHQKPVKDPDPSYEALIDLGEAIGRTSRVGTIFNPRRELA